MAVTAHVYTKLADSLTSKLVNLGTDALKVALLSAYTPGQDTHQFFADALGAGTETTGTGYSAGGLALSGVSLSDSGHVQTLTCSNPSWGAVALTASFAVFYDSTPGSSATDPLLCWWDFGGSLALSGLAIPGSGLLTLTGS